VVFLPDDDDEDVFFELLLALDLEPVDNTAVFSEYDDIQNKPTHLHQQLHDFHRIFCHMDYPDACPGGNMWANTLASVAPHTPPLSRTAYQPIRRAWSREEGVAQHIHTHAPSVTTMEATQHYTSPYPGDAH